MELTNSVNNARVSTNNFMKCYSHIVLPLSTFLLFSVLHFSLQQPNVIKKKFQSRMKSKFRNGNKDIVLIIIIHLFNYLFIYFISRYSYSQN